MPKREYQPKTGAKCGCKPGAMRDNCPNCEGTGMVIDFAAIRRAAQPCVRCVCGATPWEIEKCKRGVDVKA